VVFSQTPCIGIDGLGSHTAVLMVTPCRAILGHVSLGHVSPLADGDLTYEDAGDDHVKAFLNRFSRYLDRYESLFPQDSPAWVVCAVFRGRIAHPEQQSIIATKLRACEHIRNMPRPVSRTSRPWNYFCGFSGSCSRSVCGEQDHPSNF
jgi:hypothetical protein